MNIDNNDVPDGAKAGGRAPSATQPTSAGDHDGTPGTIEPGSESQMTDNSTPSRDLLSSGEVLLYFDEWIVAP